MLVSQTAYDVPVLIAPVKVDSAEAPPDPAGFPMVSVPSPMAVPVIGCPEVQVPVVQS